jgi:hypothetical protein
MKKFILYSLLAFLTQTSNAKIWLVDNNANSPVPISNIQVAIDSSNNGDTIMVKGSTSLYGSFTLNKSIKLIGEGCNTVSGNGSKVDEIIINHSNVSVTGFYTRFIRLKGNDALNLTLENILIDRCFIYTELSISGRPQNPFFTETSYALIKNVNIRNNIFDGNVFCPFGVCGTFLALFHRLNFDSLIIENNLLSRFSFPNGGMANDTAVIGENTMILRNNTFVNGVGDNSAGPYSIFHAGASYGPSLENAIVYNNIFYETAGYGCHNCTYYNNCFYNATGGADTLVTGNNNLAHVNPLLVGYTGGNFSFNNNYEITTGSPCIGTGAGATDIGITGGLYPYKVGVPPKIPFVQTLNIDKSAIPQNALFLLDFKANSRK